MTNIRNYATIARKVKGAKRDQFKTENSFNLTKAFVVASRRSRENFPRTVTSGVPNRKLNGFISEDNRVKQNFKKEWD